MILGDNLYDLALVVRAKRAEINNLPYNRTLSVDAQHERIAQLYDQIAAIHKHMKQLKKER